MKAAIQAQALALGFDDVSFATVQVQPQWGENLSEWLEQGRHGQMDWMQTHQDRRSSPQGLWPEGSRAQGLKGLRA